MMLPVSRRPGSLVAAFLALAAIVAGASGCSSTDAGPRLAANLGTRICTLNSWTEPVSITYSRKDTSTSEGNLPPGSQSCAEGTSVAGDDLIGNLVLPEPALPFDVLATNPWLGSPAAWIQQREVRDPGKGELVSAHNCTSSAGVGVGETRLWDNGKVRISIKRLNDDQWKEFVLILEPSQGQRVGVDPCTGTSG